MKNQENSKCFISKRYIESPWKEEDIEDVPSPVDDIHHGFLDLYPLKGGDSLTLFTQVDIERHPTNWVRYDLCYSSITYIDVRGANITFFTKCKSEVNLSCFHPHQLATLLRSRRLRRVVYTSGYPICELYDEVQALVIGIHRSCEQDFLDRQKWLGHLEGIHGKMTGLLAPDRVN